MLKIDNTVLVIIDVQGKLAQLMCDKETLFANCVVLAKAAKILDIPIIWCQQHPKSLGETIPELAAELEGLLPIDKMCFSCAGHPDFLQMIKELKRKEVIICGIETHVCVYQTAMNLLIKGKFVNIIADAVSSRTESNKNIGLTRMRDEGCAISSTEMILFELLKTSEHPKFKEIAKLIK